MYQRYHLILSSQITPILYLNPYYNVYRIVVKADCNFLSRHDSNENALLMKKKKIFRTFEKFLLKTFYI